MLIDKAAELILGCNALLFTSGAGMGVGSGLGTFRGIAAGVWPPLLQHPELDFTDMSNPKWFHKPQGNGSTHDTANFGYAFWAYRYNAYTSAAPHVGYSIAKKWSQMESVKWAFSFTSNIDGHWIKSGWDESAVHECHGSIDYMQCVENCSNRIWKTDGAFDLNVDPSTNCVVDALPTCPDCHGLARPNVLMFDDSEYIFNRWNPQRAHYEEFRSNVSKDKRTLTIVELGAGTAVPTVRNQSEVMFVDPQWTAHFIRVNPSATDAKVDDRLKKKSKGESVELVLDACSALKMIDESIQKKLTKKPKS